MMMREKLFEQPSTQAFVSIHVFFEFKLQLYSINRRPWSNHEATETKPWHNYNAAIMQP